MTPTSVCESYLSQLNRCLIEARAAGLFQERPTGEARRDQLVGFATYLFHGHGCRFEMADGDEVDFDWEDGDRSRRVVFDGWRLRAFAASRGFDYTSEQLVTAAHNLEDVGAIASVTDRPGWFTPTN